MLNELYAQQLALMSDRKALLQHRRTLERQLSDVPPDTNFDARVLYNQRVDEYNALMDELEENTARINTIRNEFNTLIEGV